MTDNHHPITPPPELVVEWADTIYQQTECDDQRDLYIATQAARWGADHELEACCEWLRSSLPGYDKHYADYLHAARRPKPPSLKELALQALYRFDDTEGHEGLTPEQIADDFVLIRRALESLPE